MLICAELSANHLQSLGRALEILEAAADAGADLFKLQCWSRGSMVLDRALTLDSGPWAGRRLHDLYDEAWTPWEWMPTLFDRARERGMIPFAAAFDADAVDYLEVLGVDRHKVASFELVDLGLIRHMKATGKPLILSTGMASQQEIDRARQVAGPATMLQCTSAYPSTPEAAGLGRMVSFGQPYGLSDHTPGIGVSVAAATLGAVYIEKHLTLKRSDGGPDAGFSLEPDEFKALVVECRAARQAVLGGGKDRQETYLRRSLWVSRDTEPGEPLVLGDNVVTARPAVGLPCHTDLTGRVAARRLRARTPLTESCL